MGAALPVLGPLADLRRAGDRLGLAHRHPSGSLSFVLHQVNEGTPFSAAVAEAHRRGFTEPHPKEDLSGEDVARKLLILLRESGFVVEREEVIVEPMISPGEGEKADPGRFLAVSRSSMRRGPSALPRLRPAGNGSSTSPASIAPRASGRESASPPCPRYIP